MPGLFFLFGKIFGENKKGEPRGFGFSHEEESKEILYCGAAHEFIGFISWAAEKNWIKRRVKRNISLKALLLPSEDANILKHTDSEELRETRVLKGAWPFLTSFQLFGSKVVIWQPKTPLAVLIEDQYIVEMMKSMFDLMWERSSGNIG